MTIANTYKYCNITRFDISADITPVNPLEDKFLNAITFHNNLINRYFINKLPSHKAYMKE